MVNSGEIYFLTYGPGAHLLLGKEVYRNQASVSFRLRHI